ncbi:hypothetical protein WKI71_36810 [Streptomyces sp. MS1.AVA.1]|uniref:Uncharacterized protein n=1 Tax=Streptomyces machairae TaxID=3134109 RepID=A0ABU8UTK4_9ACTN
MRPSYRQIVDRNQRQAARIELLISERDDALTGQRACASQLERIAGESSRMKDVVASHLVAAGHPSTVLHTVHDFTDALRQALTDAGVDIRLELARLEGAEL